MHNEDESYPQNLAPKGQLAASDQPNAGPVQDRAEYPHERDEDSSTGGARYGGLFGIGVISGTALSVILWIRDGKETQGDFGTCFRMSVLFIKLVGGAYFLSTARWRPLGAGLLASIAAGVLIFLGNCASSVKF
jgi:hypothetical protein